MSILVTGGLGYIGSHTVIELLKSGSDIIVLDNLSNSSDSVVDRIKQITNCNFIFYKGDVSDRSILTGIFKSHNIETVIHFAALKSVENSIKHPLDYYINNVGSTLVLLSCMKDFKVNRMIFSSSATVYGTPQSLPILETDPIGNNITNPYGQGKFIVERILSDLSKENNEMKFVILRYFNPIGAHESGLLGEDNTINKPSNLMPYITGVASGKFDQLSIFGNDYNTPDGTAVRDYIHVVDLAKGHVEALNFCLSDESQSLEIFNLGSGRGVSVMELVNTFENSTGIKIKYEILHRRSGDVPSCYADVSKANRELKWRTTKTLEDACVDAWRWESNNI